MTVWLILNYNITLKNSYDIFLKLPKVIVATITFQPYLKLLVNVNLLILDKVMDPLLLLYFLQKLCYSIVWAIVVLVYKNISEALVWVESFLFGKWTLVKLSTKQYWEEWGKQFSHDYSETLFLILYPHLLNSYMVLNKSHFKFSYIKENDSRIL